MTAFPSSAMPNSRICSASTKHQMMRTYHHAHIHPHIATAIARCKTLSQKPGPPSDFHDRTQSDRFVPGTKPTLLKNAKIWTGLDNGTKVVHGDILLDKGIIQSVGRIHPTIIKKYKDELVTIDLHHAWVTPG